MGEIIHWAKNLWPKQKRTSKFRAGVNYGRLAQKVQDLEAWKRQAQPELKRCAKDRIACQELRTDFNNLLLKVTQIESNEKRKRA